MAWNRSSVQNQQTGYDMRSIIELDILLALPRPSRRASRSRLDSQSLSMFPE